MTRLSLSALAMFAGTSVAMGQVQEAIPAPTLPQDMDDIVFSSCSVCHNPRQFFGDLNGYRRDLITRLRAGRTIEEGLADVEQMDSDGDGRVGYNPGLVGPPCVVDFNADGFLNQEDLNGFITEYFAQSAQPNGCVPG